MASNVCVATGLGRYGAAAEYQSVLLFSSLFHGRDLEYLFTSGFDHS